MVYDSSKYDDVDAYDNHCLVCDSIVDEQTLNWGLFYPPDDNVQPKFLCNVCAHFVWLLRFKPETGFYMQGQPK